MQRFKALSQTVKPPKQRCRDMRGSIRSKNLVRARHMLGQRAAHVLKHPGAFAIQVLKSFGANQGLLLAGAVAYYALLSIVPLLILTVIALSYLSIRPNCFRPSSVTWSG